MVETTTYDIPIDQLTSNGQKLLAYAQEHPVQCGLISCVVVAGVATIVVPLAMSAATNPATARIVAAAVNSQSNTPLATASPFLTTLQAMTTTGTLITHSGALISAGMLAADWAKGVDWAKGIDWAKGADWAGWAQAAGHGGGDLMRGAAEFGKVVGSGNGADKVVGGAVWAAGEAVGGAAWAAGEAAKGADWAAVEAVRRVGMVGRLLGRW